MTQGIGPLLRTRRLQSGRTREEQADAISRAHADAWCDPENVKRWETQKRLPRPHWHAAIAEVHGLTVDQVRAAIAVTRQQRRRLVKREEPVDRRRFIGAGAAAMGMVAFPDMATARQGIDSALAGSHMETIARLESSLKGHLSGYRGRSPRDLLGDVHRDLKTLGLVIQYPHPAGTRADLAHIAARLSGLAAIIHHDCGERGESHRWFGTAHTAALESRDPDVSAWASARHAMLAVNYGQPNRALRLAERARVEAGESVKPAAALAAAVTARALAVFGDRQGAVRASRDAETLAGRLGPQEESWTGYPAQKHYVHLSQIHTVIGDTAAAYDAQESALRRTSPASVLTRTLLSLDTATCAHIDGDPATAATMARDTWENLPSEHRTGLVTQRLTALHDALPRGRHRSQLADALVALTTQQP